jgi:hypothetical protein
MLTTLFTMLQLVYMFLDADIRLLALHIADRYLGICVRDLVFVDASGCFFEEMLPGTIKHRGFPVEPSVLSRNIESFGIQGVVRARELKNGSRAKSEKVVDPLV